MLATLSIRDVVLIDRLDLSFAPGLNALTGETGAGKSILLDALGLALGDRADGRLIRHGCDQAVVAASFRIERDHPAAEVLRAHGIDADADEVLVRRLIGADGRSRAFVNDQAVSVALLRAVGGALVEINGQFASQRLLEPATHRDLLDAFGGLSALAAACASTWADWRTNADALAAAHQQAETARRDEDYLRHALDELAALDPQPGEEARLAERRGLLQNAEKLSSALGEVASDLRGGAGGRGIAEVLRASLRALERLAGKLEGQTGPVANALERALAEITEADALLERATADLDLDPRHIEAVEERLFALRKLARKHAVAACELAAVRERLAQRLAAVDDAGALLARLQRAADATRAVFTAAAEALSAGRQAAASGLDAAVAAELVPLRLGKARFATRIARLAEGDWGAHGCDRVVFEVATNPGVPPGPLARIASGGELSRLMLALKVVLARADPVPTLVFDEVDAGIGGAVAAAVGERLARLAQEVQVLVVTHSPQVAARGHQHWKISKREVSGVARTSVDALDAAERREEIARMLAGARVTDEARAAAQSLLVGSAP